jgi:hypothetical protein
MRKMNIYARVYMVLRWLRLRRLRRRWWRWSVLRLYPDRLSQFRALIVPPHLWRDDPVFDWRPSSEKEEG